jgi:hypothetical protein
MTDNEKAATFIGWKPNARIATNMGEMPLAAPDMSDPNNYMKALDKLVVKYGAIQLTLIRHAIGIATPGFTHHVVKNEWPEALAALYDAEASHELREVANDQRFDLMPSVRGLLRRASTENDRLHARVGELERENVRLTDHLAESTLSLHTAHQKLAAAEKREAALTERITAFRARIMHDENIPQEWARDVLLSDDRLAVDTDKAKGGPA